jgi:tRNA-uridine aminocarboxypropyltransferase
VVSCRPLRPTCQRCLRPLAFCVCDMLPPIAARTRVVLLQHPREARLAICSAWLTRLALPNAELHRGFRFADDPRVREIAAAPGAALLYPGEGAVPASELAGRPPDVLVVLDGTWLQVEKMLAANASLAALPRVSVASARPSGYRDLRREPAPHCLSTIEAVACALGALEGDPARFEPMRAAFREMVEKQLACSRDGRRNPRHRAPRPSRSTRPAQPGRVGERRST